MHASRGRATNGRLSCIVMVMTGAKWEGSFMPELEKSTPKGATFKAAAWVVQELGGCASSMQRSVMSYTISVPAVSDLHRR